MVRLAGRAVVKERMRKGMDGFDPVVRLNGQEWCWFVALTRIVGCLVVPGNMQGPSLHRVALGVFAGTVMS